MTEWISIKDQKPENDLLAMVFNEKGWMKNIIAIYNFNRDTWVLYDPNYRETLTLEVTHYLPIPELPFK